MNYAFVWNILFVEAVMDFIHEDIYYHRDCQFSFVFVMVSTLS